MQATSLPAGRLSASLEELCSMQLEIDNGLKRKQKGHMVEKFPVS
jgi:hypothetical protein